MKQQIADLRSEIANLRVLNRSVIAKLLEVESAMNALVRAGRQKNA